MLPNAENLKKIAKNILQEIDLSWTTVNQKLVKHIMLGLFLENMSPVPLGRTPFPFFVGVSHMHFVEC